MSEKIIVMSSAGGPTAAACTAGALKAIAEHPAALEIVAGSGVSGAAAPMFGAAVGKTSDEITGAVGEMNSDELFSPSNNVLEGLFDCGVGLTGLYRGVRYRRFLEKHLGDLLLADAKFDVSIPAFNLHEGAVVHFNRTEWPRVGGARACRASAAVPLVFEAESTVDPDNPQHHYVDAGLHEPLDISPMASGEWTRCIVIINDLVRLKPDPNLMNRKATFFWIALRCLADSYADRLVDTIKEVQSVCAATGKQVQLMYAPTSINFFEFTSAQMKQATEHARERCLWLLDNPTRSGSL